MYISLKMCKQTEEHVPYTHPDRAVILPSMCADYSYERVYVTERSSSLLSVLHHKEAAGAGHHPSTNGRQIEEDTSLADTNFKKK